MEQQAAQPAFLFFSFPLPSVGVRGPDSRCLLYQPATDAQEHLDTEQQPARFQGRP